MENLDKFAHSLKSLDASGNRIHTLAQTPLPLQWGEQQSFGVACLTKLVRLDLRENQIANLSGLEALKCLEWLNLSHNLVG